MKDQYVHLEAWMLHKEDSSGSKEKSSEHLVEGVKQGHSGVRLDVFVQCFKLL